MGVGGVIGGVDDGAHAQYQCEEEETVRAHYFNVLKEATFVSQGSAGGVMSMTRAAQTDLWRSVVTSQRQLAYKAEGELSGGGGGARRCCGR